MRRKFREFRAIALILLLGIIPAGFAKTCPPVCKDMAEKYDELEKTIRRCKDVKAANQDFISRLRTDDESKRLKANSNIRIAEKRIAEAEKQKRELDAIKAQKCNDCKEA